ncbi:ATP-binding protein [Kitasatospora sp. NPDC057965]|uniref:ATP-binding protein n=1 Tax=Kitasatospora sp. NPDC057965 TaxID=3346291 RepID=UPI0036D8185F
MTFTFAPATREQAKARIALEGPSGSGKTYTALTLATTMSPRVALIDTERGSASKYAAGHSGSGFTFDTLQMSKYDPRDLVAALATAGQAGYGAVIVDSLTHFWSGTGGMLELVDAIGKRGGGGGNFGGWKEARPFERAMIDALLAYPGHVIVTMRTKSEYVIEEDSRGKKQVRKVGTKAEQREGLEYEFDIVGDLDQENTLVVTKSRCPELSGAVINRPSADLATTVLTWLEDGTEVPDAAELVGELMADGLTVDGALALHKRAEQHRLLGAAVLHPVTGIPSTLGELIVERGRQLRAGGTQRLAAVPAVPGGEPTDHEVALAAGSGYEAVEREAVAESDRRVQAARTAVAGPELATAPQMRRIHAVLTKVGITDRTERHTVLSALVGRHISSANELTKADAGDVIDSLDAALAQPDPGAYLRSVAQNISAAA